MPGAVENVRAMLRLLTPDDITPVGRRQIERVLDEHTAENDAPYAHRVNVNIGGRGAHPIVTLWCMDCLLTVADLNQQNPWAEVQALIAEHRAQPSEREKLNRVIPPGPGDTS